jgi:hypothetical protein
MNQLLASGSDEFNSLLRLDLKYKIFEIRKSIDLSEDEKNSKISTLKKAVQTKLKQSEFYIF